MSFDGSTSKLSFDISWNNSWTAPGGIRNAVWVFVKQAPISGPQWLHANIDSVTTTGPLFGFVASDNNGVFIRRKFLGVGNIPSSTVTVKLSGLVGPYQDFKVFGIEMVNIPEGA